MSRSHTDSLSLHDYDTHTNTKEDAGNSEEEFRDEEEEEERDKDAVSEEDICLKLVRFRCPNTTKLYHYPSWAVISRIWKKICQTSSGLGAG